MKEILVQEEVKALKTFLTLSMQVDKYIIGFEDWNAQCFFQCSYYRVLFLIKEDIELVRVWMCFEQTNIEKIIFQNKVGRGNAFYSDLGNVAKSSILFAFIPL